MIVFLAPETEENLVRLREVAEWMGKPYVHVDTLSLMTFAGTFLLGSAAAQATVKHAQGEFDPAAVTGVWTRGLRFPAVPVHGTAENLQFHEQRYAFDFLLHAMGGACWLNHPACIEATDNKLLQLRLARELGFTVPETCVTRDPAQAREFAGRFDGVVIKRISAGARRENADRILFTRRLRRQDYGCLDAVTNCLTLLQEPIEKAYELRVSVVGQQVFAAGFDSTAHASTAIDSRRWTLTDDTYFRTELSEAQRRQVVAIVQAMGLNYAAVDLIVNRNGELVFLEVNGCGQWSFVELMTGHAISEAIVEMLAHGNNNQGRLSADQRAERGALRPESGAGAGPGQPRALDSAAC